MNVQTNQTPIAKIRGFNGMWARGSDYNCPLDHLTDCYNCIFPGASQISIRENTDIQNDIGGRTIISFSIATLSAGPILLTLNSDGALYDETHARLLGTFVGADDFVALSIFGRVYVTLKENNRAYSGSHLYWYDGVTFSTTGWDTPTTPVTLATAASGIVDDGVHEFAVSFQSPTGFLSKPSPISAVAVDGTQKINISSIPLGPAGTIARVLFATKANEGELFFVPNGTINDNTTTTFTYNEPDSALQSSADYLNDLMWPAPSCAALKFYSGRLVLIGRDAFPDSILFSEPENPETINLVRGAINLPVDYGQNTASGGMVMRDTLYITKPNGTFSVQDNGDNPNTWHVAMVDSGIGAFDTGISVFQSSLSAEDAYDTCIVANKSGVLLFNGTYSYPSLTYKIENVWQLIDQNDIFKIQITHDLWRKRVYISVPLSPAAAKGGRITTTTDGLNHVILMMDYQEGLQSNTVKWSVWTPPGPYYKIAVENFLLNYGAEPFIYQLAYSKGGTEILKIVSPHAPGTPDKGHSGTLTAINQYFITGPAAPGGIYNFTGLMFIFDQGAKTVTPSLLTKNRAIGPIDQRGMNLTSYDTQMELFRGINFQAPGLQVMLYNSNVTTGGTQGYFFLTALDIYGKLAFPQYPALSEMA